ncbi:hypothetical protein EDC01DRAFT_746856 [Geopyxis carbonaria]|nr:hypothetical protein EDC01DRAFT_746856 [Geopyxis carbonaria]
MRSTVSPHLQSPRNTPARPSTTPAPARPRFPPIIIIISTRSPSPPPAPPQPTAHIHKPATNPTSPAAGRRTASTPSTTLRVFSSRVCSVHDARSGVAGDGAGVAAALRPAVGGPVVVTVVTGSAVGAAVGRRWGRGVCARLAGAGWSTGAGWWRWRHARWRGVGDERLHGRRRRRCGAASAARGRRRVESVKTHRLQKLVSGRRGAAGRLVLGVSPPLGACWHALAARWIAAAAGVLGFHQLWRLGKRSWGRLDWTLGTERGVHSKNRGSLMQKRSPRPVKHCRGRRVQGDAVERWWSDRGYLRHRSETHEYRHMRHFLRPQPDEARADTPQPDLDQNDAVTQSTDLPLEQQQHPDTDLWPPRFAETLDPLAGPSGLSNLTPPARNALTIANTTLLDFFDPTGFAPSYSNLLESMDYVCATKIWVNFEDFLIEKGFGYQFWVVVSANTNQHLGLRRTELLEKLTQGKIQSNMVGVVVANWEFVWRLAAWLADGGEWEDVGPVRMLLEA